MTALLFHRRCRLLWHCLTLMSVMLTGALPPALAVPTQQECPAHIELRSNCCCAQGSALECGMSCCRPAQQEQQAPVPQRATGPEDRTTMPLALPLPGDNAAPREATSTIAAAPAHYAAALAASLQLRHVRLQP